MYNVKLYEGARAQAGGSTNNYNRGSVTVFVTVNTVMLSKSVLSSNKYRPVYICTYQKNVHAEI